MEEDTLHSAWFHSLRHWQKYNNATKDFVMIILAHQTDALFDVCAVECFKLMPSLRTFNGLHQLLEEVKLKIEHFNQSDQTISLKELPF